MDVEPGAPEVWVGVLGPLVLRVGGAEVPVPGPRRRALLATLALARGRVVYLADKVYSDAATLPTARPTAAEGQSLAYDALGRPVTQTLPTGGTKTLAYKAFEITETLQDMAPVVTRRDGLGRILRTERQVGATLESVAATYDAADRIRTLKLQDGAVTHGFTYDTLGRLVAAAGPDATVSTSQAVVTAWLLCGVLDITAACLQAWIQAGRAPGDVLRG